MYRLNIQSAMRKQNTNRQNRTRGFTLVELMIITAILGILAAIVFPEFQGHIQRAKETQAKANLRLLREAIERYAADHNGIPPGYFGNNPALTPIGGVTKMHLVPSSKPYLLELPKNPFNDLASILVIDNSSDVPASPTQTDTYGWIYKPSTKTVKLNWNGTDSEGNAYYNY